MVGGAALLEQPLELRLKDLPRLRALRRDLEGHGEAIRVEAVVEGDQRPVHAGLDQVVGVLLRGIGYLSLISGRDRDAIFYSLLYNSTAFLFNFTPFEVHTRLETDADDPLDEAVVGPREDVLRRPPGTTAATLDLSPLRLEVVAVKVDELEALDAELQ